MQDTKNQEPYRATKLWNEVIAAFHSGMPLKKHRRRIQTFNNCFTATEAVTWLHCYLMNNSNFGKDVTRQQSVNLLQKFLKCHVIESVVIRSKKKEFADDSHLYRFSSLLSHHAKPSALCLIQSPSFGVRTQKVQNSKDSPKSKNSPLLQKENLPECHIVVRKLSPDEVKLMWKRVFLYRLEKLLSFSPVNDILDEKSIDGQVIKHNVSRLSKSGVVCLIDKTDDIPSWVISAMKCLANWPNASGSGSCLPNYPGFEKDVFKVVRDFFLNPQVPLIPADLTLPLIKVFCHFTQQKYIDPSNEEVFQENQSISSDFSCNSKFSHPPSHQVQTSTPLNTNESTACYQGNVQAETSHGQLLLDDPEVMWEYPSAMFYETDFATSNPVTRMVSDSLVSRSNSSSYCNSVESINSVSTISVCSQSGPCDYRQAATSPMKAWNSNLYLQDRVRDTGSSVKDYSPLPMSASVSRVYDDPISPRSPSLNHFSGEVYSYEINDLDVSNLSERTVVEVDPKSEDCGAGGSIHNVFSNSTLSSRSSSHSNQNRSHLVNRSLKKELPPTAITQELKLSFQLILLLLPSVNRRQLHLLLRLLNKVIKNGKFVLNIKASMRDYLLETFLPAIVQFEDNQTILFQMASFLLDDCEVLFQTPLGIKEEVEDLSRSCYGRIKYSVDDTCFLSYCEMVSKQKYEEERLSASAEALKDLLNKILQDPKITEKEKKKKIKQFREIHPEVYNLQFPDKELPYKSKPSLFSKLSNLRI